MATKAQVRSRLNRLVARLDEADDSVRADVQRALSRPRTIQIDVPDLDASFWSKLEKGRLTPLTDGVAPAVDIRVTASSDDLVAVIDGERNLFSSYLAGQVRIQASLADLLALRKLA